MNFHCFQSLEDIAKDYIGEIVYVGWPHLYQAKVISVSDDDARFVDSKGYYCRRTCTLVLYSMNLFKT
jgi:hypothetical protein